MTLAEFNNLESKINEAKDCVIVYKNGKPAIVKIIDLPVIHNGTEMTIGEVFEDYKRQIKEFIKEINLIKLTLKKLYEVQLKTIDFVNTSNTANAVQIADIKEEIK